MLRNEQSKPPHDQICKCQICMTSSRLSLEEFKKHSENLKDAMVDRRNPDDPIKPLMLSVEVKAVINADTNIDMLKATGLPDSALGYIKRYTHPVVPQELTLTATWNHHSVEKATTGSDANVFGSVGILVVPSNVNVIQIPKMNALAVPKKFLEKYGAELIPLDHLVYLEPASHEALKTQYVIQYDFDESYVNDYVLKAQGGGGIFVETHPFPHLYTPLSAECSGALILGVNMGKNQFSFAGFEIPFGYTMKVQSMTIHTDSFFVGPYAASLTITDLADVVLFRKDTPARDIQLVTQQPVAPIANPSLSEERLAATVNNEMMIKKIRHDVKTAHFGLRFFTNLPNAVLSKIKDDSPETKEAYQQRFTQ